MSDKKQTQKKSKPASNPSSNTTTKKTKVVEAKPAPVTPVTPVTPVAPVTSVTPVTQAEPKAKKPKAKKEKQVKSTNSVPVAPVEPVVAPAEPVVAPAEPVVAPPDKPKSVKNKNKSQPSKSNKPNKSKKPKAETPKEVVPVEATQEGGNVDGETGEDKGPLKNNRFFKVIAGGTTARGRFCGTKPKQAANKALTSIIRSMTKDGKDTTGEIKFSIKECTRGSKAKEYRYIGRRQELLKPMEVEIGKKGDVANKKTISYKYNNKVMKDKTPVVTA